MGLVGFSIFAVAIKLWPFFKPCPKNRWTGKSLNTFQRLFFANFICFADYWNEFEVHGDEKIQGANTLMVGPHSRCAYDNFYILNYLHPAWIASHFIFQIPGFSSLFKWWGASPSKGLHGLSSDEEFLRLIVDGESPLWVLPGGAYEGYRPYAERNILAWKEEPGFARILAEYSNTDEMAAKETKTQIIPFYTRNGDSIFYNHPWWYTFSSHKARWAFHEIAKKNVEVILYLLVFAGAGMGFMLFPRPVKLDTYFGEPVYLQKGENAKSLARRVKASLQKLIDSTNALPENEFKRPGFTLYSFVFGAFMLLQNIVFIAFTGVWITLVAVPIFIVRGIMARNGEKKGKKGSDTSKRVSNGKKKKAKKQ